MVKFTKIMLSVWILFFLFSCSKKTTEPENENIVLSGNNKIYQIPGCQYGGLGKTSYQDSSFAYQFDTVLKVDFLVYSNCCPDLNRFEFSCVIQSNIIEVTVVDTAEHLCDCTCPYIIHSEFYYLPLDRYIFSCLFNDSWNESIVYMEEVNRSKNHP